MASQAGPVVRVKKEAPGSEEYIPDQRKDTPLVDSNATPVRQSARIRSLPRKQNWSTLLKGGSRKDVTFEEDEALESSHDNKLEKLSNLNQTDTSQVSQMFTSDDITEEEVMESDVIDTEGSLRNDETSTLWSSGGDKENVQPPATLNVIVNNKAAIPHMPDIGIFVLYYCRHCAFYSSNLLETTEHLKSCKKGGFLEEPHNILERDVKTKIQQHVHGIDEHSYSVGAEDNAYKVESEGKATTCKLISPRRWFCAACISTQFYSQADYQAHKLCHGDNGLESLHCFVCKANNQESGLKGNEWHRIKNHLFTAHKYHFRIRCEQCDSVFRGHSQYNSHVRVHQQICPVDTCRFGTTDPTLYEIHTKCHDNPETFSCCFCGFKNKGKSHQWAPMYNHIVVRHPGHIKAEYECPKCDRGFVELRNFGKHMQYCFGNRKRNCPYCDKYMFASDYDEHVQQRCSLRPSSNVKVQEEEQVEITPEQTEINVAISEMMRETEESGEETTQVVEEAVQSEDITQETVEEVIHIKQESQETEETNQTNDGPKPVIGGRHKCKQHGLAFRTKDDLTKHLIKVHWGVTKEKIMAANQERLVEDPMLVTPGALTERITGNQQGLYKCELCYKKFKNNVNLARHKLRVHPPERMHPVSCKFCAKKFKNKVHLRNHVREIHEGKKRRKTNFIHQAKIRMCDTCGYTTPSNVRLRNHIMSVHQGSFPYTCDICNYSTNESSDLRRHKWKHANFKKYSCEQCTYKSNQRWLLVNHCKNQHGVQLPIKKRDTMGTMYSAKQQRKRAKETADAQLIQHLKIEPCELIIKPTKTEEVLDETHYLLQAANQSELTVEMVESQSAEVQEVQEVVYIQGESASAEEALMLLAYGGNAMVEQTVETSEVIEEEVIQ